jgi:hypothetical protein
VFGEQAPSGSDRDRIRWADLVAAVRPLLPGDIAANESATSRQVAHYGSGIRMTLADDVVYLSSSYSLIGYELTVVAETLREVAVACEMVTGRAATSVIFDQPGLLAGDIAGRPRIHGYALLANGCDAPLGAGGTMRLPASELAHFDRIADRRNA